MSVFSSPIFDVVFQMSSFFAGRKHKIHCSFELLFAARTFVKFLSTNKKLNQRKQSFWQCQTCFSFKLNSDSLRREFEE